MPPGWRIVDESYEVFLRDEAIARTLQRHSTADVQRLVNLMAKGETQQSVSGLVRRTVKTLYKLYMETDPAAWCQISCPRPLSDEELTGLVQQLRDVPLPDDKVYAKARVNDAEAAEAGDWELFISRGIAAKVLAGETKFNKKPIPRDVVEIYEQLLQQTRAVLLQQLARQTEATYELLDKFHEAYAQLKLQTGSLRFEDVTRAHGE